MPAYIRAKNIFVSKLKFYFEKLLFTKAEDDSIDVWDLNCDLMTG